MSSASPSYKQVPNEEPDVLELKKAMATGSGSSDKNAVSGGECLTTMFYIMNVNHCKYHIVLPIVCYCFASILMTVTNKVLVLRHASHSQDY